MNHLFFNGIYILGYTWILLCDAWKLCMSSLDYAREEKMGGLSGKAPNSTWWYKSILSTSMTPPVREPTMHAVCPRAQPSASYFFVNA